MGRMDPSGRIAAVTVAPQDRQRAKHLDFVSDLLILHVWAGGGIVLMPMMLGGPRRAPSNIRTVSVSSAVSTPKATQTSSGRRLRARRRH